MSAENRIEGYYRVKHYGKWFIAGYSKDFDCWLLVGREMPFYTDEFDEIEQTPIEMPSPEPPQTTKP